MPITSIGRPPRTITEKRSDPDFFERLLLPDYDELSLYLMSYTLLLLFIVNVPPNTWSSSNISFTFDGSTDFGVLTYLSILIMGMILSFYHAFSSRRKTIIEKQIMLIFAGIICAFSGIWGAAYILVHSSGWILLFPIWNIFSGMMLLGALRTRQMNENNISDENVSLIEVMLSTGLVSIIFIFCHATFELNWAATFSICIAWSTTCSNPINAILLKQKV